MIIYPKATTRRFSDQLGRMTKDDLWDLIQTLGIPTDDRPPEYDWEHKELRQRIVDWVYDPDFKIKRL